MARAATLRPSVGCHSAVANDETQRQCEGPETGRHAPARGSGCPRGALTTGGGTVTGRTAGWTQHVVQRAIPFISKAVTMSLRTESPPHKMSTSQKQHQNQQENPQPTRPNGHMPTEPRAPAPQPVPGGDRSRGNQPNTVEMRNSSAHRCHCCQHPSAASRFWLPHWRTKGSVITNDGQQYPSAQQFLSMPVCAAQQCKVWQMGGVVKFATKGN